MCHLLLWCAFSAVAAAGAVHSSDSGAVTEDIPYGKRISDALTGFIIGWILLVFCMLLIFVVEKQAVKFDLILSRCRKSTRVLSGAVVDPDNEEGTVFLKGITSVGSGTSPLHDNHTGFHYKGQRNPIRLRRQVMMYQWVEHETKEEKKSVYSYRMEWSEADHDSSRFKNPAGHRNPPRHPPLYSETRDAAAVRLGQFTLSPELVAKMNKWEICDIPQGDGSGFSDGGLVECEMKYHMDTSHVNYGNLLNTSKRDLSDFLVYNGQLRSPRVGTVKVCYEAVLELGEASVLGVQTRDTLRAFTYADAQDMQPPCLRRITNALTCQGGHQEYDVQDYRVGEEDSGGCCGGVCCMCAPIAQALAGGVVGTEVLLLEERHTTPVQLFRDEHSKFGKRLNLMRAAGCLGISIGIFLIFNPISVVLSFIPYLSGLISHLFFALALIIGFVIGAAEISLAWVFHRPHYMLGDYTLLYALSEE